MKDRLENHRVVAVLVSVFMISFLGLMLQIALTRIFSTTIWYHYTFVAVSIALFGWGLGGLVLHFFKQRVHGEELGIIAALLLVLSLFMPLYLLVISRFPANPSSINGYFVFSLVPFLLAGTCLAFLYTKFTEAASKLYFADLTGASLACLFAEPVLWVLGAEPAVLLLGIIASASSLLVSVFSGKKKLVAMSLVGFVVLPMIFAINAQTSFLNISSAPTKEMFAMIRDNRNLTIVLTRWNSFSRIDVVEGFSGKVLAVIFIDADASTEVLGWNGIIEDLRFLNNSLDILPYSLVKDPKTLVIGPGGGKDVLYALAGGSSEIMGVELNPIIVDVMKNYGEKVGYLYNNLSNVNVMVDEGRSFISRSAERFDVITLTFVDSWAAISAGGYALAENYLYTKEAFVNYLEHLTDNGLLVMTRWNHEIPRLVSTIVEACQALGESAENVGKCMAIVQHELEPGKVRVLLVLKKSPFTEVEAEAFKNRVSALGSQYSAFYIPYVTDLVEPYHALFNGTIDVDRFCADFSYRVDAVSDDSPFYFNLELGVPLVLGNLVIMALLLSLGFIIVPLVFALWSRRQKVMQHAASVTGTGLFVLFFSVLGIGYMLLEIALIQKFILFLGYPTRALTVTLFSLLLSGGIGSLISGRFVRKHQDLTKNILIASSLVIAIAIVYVFSLPVLFMSLLQQNSAVRIVVTFFLLFPLGFFMGIPFPSGLRILNTEFNENVSWMWGVNGAASVLGSVLAALAGILYGFSYVMILGATAYVLSLVCALKWRSKKA